jgi:hypothetical protein
LKIPKGQSESVYRRRTEKRCRIKSACFWNKSKNRDMYTESQQAGKSNNKKKSLGARKTN